MSEPIRENGQTKASSRIARYYPARKRPIEGSYMVRFKPNHTMAQHLALIPELKDMKVVEWITKRGYSVHDMSDDLLLRVRRDPGVDFIEQNARGAFVGVVSSNSDDSDDSGGEVQEDTSSSNDDSDSEGQEDISSSGGDGDGESQQNV